MSSEASSAIAFLAGAFLLGRAYRETASSEQMLQATLDSVREGVGAVDYRGHLRAWNSSLLAMLGVGGDKIRQGVPLSEAIASAGKLGRRVRGVEAAAPTTNRPVLAPVVEGFPPTELFLELTGAQTLLSALSP
jgi:PAS domain-containing protein